MTDLANIVLASTEGHRPGYVYTEKDWNPVDLDMAYKYPSLRYV